MTVNFLPRNLPSYFCVSSNSHTKPRRLHAFTHFSTCAIGSAIFCLLSSPTPAQEQKGAGVTIGADAKDLGLPLYPGSRRHKDKDEDSPAANLGLWGAGSGFKLAVLKMESDDSPDRVAAFYKKALAKYGKVLDCSHPSPSDTDAAKNAPANQLTCADDKPDKGGQLFKSGTKDKQHIVGIQPNVRGSLYQLVHIANWGNDEKK
jgi:hypothetical protein